MNTSLSPDLYYIYVFDTLVFRYSLNIYFYYIYILSMTSLTLLYNNYLNIHLKAFMT